MGFYDKIWKKSAKKKGKCIFMDSNPMKILVIEDDIEECEKLRDCAKGRKDIEIVAITDSDLEALTAVKIKHPEGIILDIELNNAKNGSTDAMGFLENLKKLKLNYHPIIIVTTHVNSKRTYEILHKNGVELILYKDHPNYSCNLVFNKFINFRINPKLIEDVSIEKIIRDEKRVLSEYVNHELDLVGIASKYNGREYIYEAIMYLIDNEEKGENVIKYLSKKYKKGETTISNGIEHAIKHGWDISSIEDLEKFYTNKIDANRGYPTPMELIYYYARKAKKSA